MQFLFEIQNNINDENGLNIDELFENEPKYDISGQEGILLCGFYMDGGKWDINQSLIVDSPHRYTQLPHILCKLIMVILCNFD